MQTEEKSEKRTLSYVNEVFRQIESKPDVIDIVITNVEGNPVKTTMDKNLGIQVAGLYGMLLDKVYYSLQKIDPTDELVMLRVRSLNHEVLITPDEKITVLVIQSAIDRMEV